MPLHCVVITMLSTRKSPAMLNVCRLITEESAIDDIGNQVSKKTEREIFCAEFAVSQSAFFEAAQADIQAEKGLIINSLDYAEEKLIAYAGKKYTVYRRYARSDGLIELYLTGGESYGKSRY